MLQALCTNNKEEKENYSELTRLQRLNGPVGFQDNQHG